jgi:hypothetical protein
LPKKKVIIEPELKDVEKLKDKIFLNLKDLGSLKGKVLLFLAENPIKNAQETQKGLGYPPSQYPNILKAVKALEKLELVSSETATSKKNVPMKLYSCNENGLLYILAKNPNANLLKILDANKTRNEFARDFRKLYDLWGQESFIGFIRSMKQFLPLIAKEGIENAIPFIFMRGFVETRHIDSKRRKEIALKTMKEFPNVKQFMKEWKKAINELV